ncbi:hypothetical protein [Kushneria aurantia]|uniref:Uncharacterized protein n=1 Tax=Kushneria aurantia TaxID=504092 RepID=A0ABV6G4R6_9GAMM
MFNGSHLEHLIIGIGIQLVMWPFFGRWAGGAIVVALFLGREIAQHEYRGGGGNAVAWYYGVVYHWSVDSVLDVLVPLTGCLVVAIAVSAIGALRRQRNG